MHLYASLESQVCFACDVRIVHVYPIMPGILLGTTRRWPADRTPIEIMEVTWANTPTRVPNIRWYRLCKYQNCGIIYGRRSLAWNCDQDAIAMPHGFDLRQLPERHLLARFTVNAIACENDSERLQKHKYASRCKNRLLAMVNKARRKFTFLKTFTFSCMHIHT